MSRGRSRDGATEPGMRTAANDLVALLRQIERRPDLGRRLLNALEQLLERDDPALCLELARHYAGRPMRSRAEAERWVRELHRVLLSANQQH
jgi:hypothetical protein